MNEINEAVKTAMKENFADLLAESFDESIVIEGSVVRGIVIAVDKDAVMIDAGLKSEGRVPIKEFTPPGQDTSIAVGDEVEVYVERMEGVNGQAVLSREKARREEAWAVLEDAHEKQERVTGVIFNKVKGGFTVDLDGATAFLPGSQVDIRPVRDITPLMGNPQPFQILKIDRKRGNIVVSRRAILEESRAEDRKELVSNLQEGQVLPGTVKNITDYGAFIDLGGVDGLLHVTDISWRRINHPSEMLQIGQTIDVQVIRFNAETQRISLGMKQLTSDPWDEAKASFVVGTKLKGRVTNITDYGAFVELSDGVEGLVHVSEMSWTKKNHPGKIVSSSQEVEVMVLEIDDSKRRISLSLRQCIENPWEDFNANYTVGSEAEGEIRNITEFGLFVGLTEEIDGLVHLSDISWDVSGDEAIQDYKKGQVIKTKILEIDIEKERISLGIKQLSEDTTSEGLANMKKGDIVTCTITSVITGRLNVEVGESGISGSIRRSDLSRDRDEQRTERFAVGEKVDAQIINVDKSARKLGLSIKAREMAEEKRAMAEYGSSDSGASLGDILGAALAKRDGSDDADDADAAKEAKSKSKARKAKSATKAKAAKAAKPAEDATAESEDAPDAKSESEDAPDADEK